MKRSLRPVSRIDRYLLREILVPFAAALALAVLAVFVTQSRRLARAALGLAFTPEDAALIFFAALPPFLVLAVPVAYLASCLVGLGRLAQDLELVALKAVGAGPFRIARVPIAAGAATALACLPISLAGEPYGLRLLYDRLVDVGLRNLTRAVTPGVFSEDFRGSAIYAKAARADGALADLLFFDDSKAGGATLLVARSGGFRATEDGRIVLDVDNGELHLAAAQTVDIYDRIRFEHATIPVDARSEISRRTAFVSELGRMTNDELREQSRALGRDNPVGRRMERNFWRRFAFPSMAFVLGVVAAAIALTGGVRSRARNALLAIATLVAYHVLTRLGDFLIEQNAAPPALLVWIPNLIVFVAATAVLARAGGPA